MSDALTLTELNNLQLELLPARTVLSMLALIPEGSTGTVGPNGDNGTNSNGVPTVNVAGMNLTALLGK